MSLPQPILDYFESLEKEHGIKTTSAQKKWYFSKYRELGDNIYQEYPSTPDEAFRGSSEGFFYLKELNQIRELGQIGKVPHQPNLATYTAWDLGFGDSTSIWMFQMLPTGSIHVIDFYENNGEGLHHYEQVLRQKKYNYAKHFLPHDAGAHDAASGLSYAEQARRLNMEVIVLNRQKPGKSSFMAEIQRVRNTLARCFFDEAKCSYGLKCLEGYRKKWNEQMGSYTSEPVHDWASHASDSFRYLVQAVETNKFGAKQDMSAELKKLKQVGRRKI